MHLRFESGARRGEALEPGTAPLVFGRDRTCHVVLDDEKASRRHAALTRQPDGGLRLEDLGSANGTWVDGERITRPVALRPGSRVRIGASELSVTGAGGARAFRRRPGPVVVAGILGVVAIAAALTLVLTLGGSDEPDRRPAGPASDSAPPVEPDMSRLTSATALVTTTVDGRRTNVASGWVLDADEGWIVTNAHVLHLQRRTGSMEVSVFLGGRRRQARPLGVAPCEDLALLKVSSPGLRGLPLAPPGDVQRGDTVVAAGFPFAGKTARNVVPTQARVVAADGPAPGPHGAEVVPLPDVVQLAAKLRPGDSGGPVVNGDTEVVGVIAVSANSSGTRRTYAVTAARARPVLDELAAGRSRAWLGAALQPGAGHLALTATVKGGPADRAGLSGGPWILEKVGNRRVGDDMTSYCDATAGARKGDRARLTVREAVEEDGDGFVPKPGGRRRVLTFIYQ